MCYVADLNKVADQLIIKFLNAQRCQPTNGLLCTGIGVTVMGQRLKKKITLSVIA